MHLRPRPIACTQSDVSEPTLDRNAGGFIPSRRRLGENGVKRGPLLLKPSLVHPPERERHLRSELKRQPRLVSSGL